MGGWSHTVVSSQAVIVYLGDINAISKTATKSMQDVRITTVHVVP